MVTRFIPKEPSITKEASVFEGQPGVRTVTRVIGELHEIIQVSWKREETFHESLTAGTQFDAEGRRIIAEFL